MAAGVERGHTIEQELRRQLDTTQSITHIGSWEWKLGGDTVIWSDELYRIYGYEPRAMPVTVELFLSRIHRDDRERVEREIQSSLVHPGRFAYRERIVRPDGTVRTLDTIGEAIADEHGQTARLAGTCLDVTEAVAREARIRFFADVIEYAEIGLSAFQLDPTPDPAPDAPPGPPALRLVAFNAATERLLGGGLGSRLGQPLAEIVPVFADATLHEVARAVAAGGAVQRLAPFRAPKRAPAGSAPAPLLAGTLFALPDRHLGLALEDVTDQVSAQVIQAGERRALEMLAGGAPLPDILAVIVRAIEQASVDTIASILLLDETGTRVQHGAAPGLPDAFNAQVHDQPIGPRAGSCGTAMFRRAPVIVTDIATDPLWDDYRELARAHGLASSWSFPILDEQGGVLGTFALYHRTPRAPDDAALELMKRAAHVTGIVLGRRALDEQRRALAGRIEAAREDERTQIAREVHDQLGQTLTALKLDVGWLQRRISDPALAGKLDDMARQADDILRAVRRIAADLRPGILDDLGLRAAIEWQAEDFTRRTGTPCTVRSELGDLQLERGLATNVFRIFQEALTNVARHAGARSVEVSLGLDHGQLRLEVIDDGVGVPEVGPRGTTLGILGMRERAWRLGGECTVKRRVPRGTVVTVVVPLRFPAEHATDARR
ncbi:MAG TPA: GAF domain-containing protein [Kofleriaceae bacterium]|jgi:PAS domain S-box-containing protein|nr:GAF domain-containing protein [Kofleriaceae bacterium]